ncbi:MAG: UDP-N-acetylglucosamine 1-carboxyvinyltransferase [Deltaproteobacteria bacterium]|jgi:UDP-N-acetylglucosamine 1-carboxyvinyltransferase|nr:UDP-N-acetylglucosamine 1-carboxyvinyltransferase [Deltaproteobacteria bacterium]
MDKLIIEGGQPLAGRVRISGAKNAALPLMAAAILPEEPLKLTNLPALGDLLTMAKLLRFMGGRVSLGGSRLIDENQAELDLTGLNRPEAPHEMVKTMRASALVLGPLLARLGRAKVSMPGGCAIGVRPIDLHLKALRAMGAVFDLSGGDIVARTGRGGLKGAEIRFDTVTVTGTENLMMAAVLAKGRTVIANAAREPEVTDTAQALLAMGAKIEGLDTDVLTIDGVSSLSGTSYRVMPDRIEAGTFMAAVALAGGEIILEDFPHDALATVVAKFRETGLDITPIGTDLNVKARESLWASDVTTQTYPGFPTDMQAQFMAMMTAAQGTSLITETIFENRFMHVSELRRLGADITLEGRTAVVKGVPTLSGAPLTASDLRASAGLVLAALAARGESQLLRVYHLDRGYEGLDRKLNNLGAVIRRVRA